jgi:hypothetical protein
VVGAFGIDGGRAVLGQAEGREVIGRGIVGLVFVIAEGGDQRDRAGGVAQDGEEVIPFVGIIATADEIAGQDDEIGIRTLASRTLSNLSKPSCTSPK